MVASDYLANLRRDHQAIEAIKEHKLDVVASNHSEHSFPGFFGLRVVMGLKHLPRGQIFQDPVDAVMDAVARLEGKHE